MKQVYSRPDPGWPPQHNPGTSVTGNARRSPVDRLARWLTPLVLWLAACSSAPVLLPADPQTAPVPLPSAATVPAAPARVIPVPEALFSVDVNGAISQPRSRWIPVAWNDLPGWQDDNLAEAWSAWLKSCERAPAQLLAVCSEVRRLSIADEKDQRDWLMRRLQPYRVVTPQGEGSGLLTGYFEPQLEARRESGGGFNVPIYQPPRDLAQRKPWFTRQEMETRPGVQAAMQDRVIAYLADPIDALVLQIQGSGRLSLTEPDGRVRTVRVAYAGTNDQPYRSVGRWLLDQGLIKDASWPGIKAWLAQNPQRQQELLWSNPRIVFFKEEPMADLDAAFGPKGAQGVPLTPGRSIAVDPGSIPYGTPVWLASAGSQINLQRLVLAQDTGSAITGAVRADYFAGWGAPAADLAGRLKQPLQMWVLWPK